MHSIAADDAMQMLSIVSNMNASSEFLTRLPEIGRERAPQWLGNAYGRVGEASSANVRCFL